MWTIHRSYGSSRRRPELSAVAVGSTSAATDSIEGRLAPGFVVDVLNSCTQLVWGASRIRVTAVCYRWPGSEDRYTMSVYVSHTVHRGMLTVHQTGRLAVVDTSFDMVVSGWY